MNAQHRVIVVGAGYAGLVAAKRLARRAGERARVTLINATDQFVERPRLHQVATGQRVKELPLRELIGSVDVDLVVGWVDGIDLAGKQVDVRTADGPRGFAYDTLVLANGTVIDTAAVPGVAEHALTLEPWSASRAFRRLSSLESGTVLVAGGGLTGIEAATEIAERFPGLSVTLVSRGEPGGRLSPRARRHLGKVLRRLGIQVRGGAGIAALEAGRAVLDDSASIAFDECVWAGGFAIPALAAESGLAVNPKGRPLVDETLRSVSHPDVYVVGDAAAVAGRWGEELAYGCRVGGFMGPYLGDALATRIAGAEPQPFRFRYIHQCVSLGRRDAIIQFVHAADETPRRAVLTGRSAVWYKELVLRSATWLFRAAGPKGLPRRAKVSATV
ncbi:MAG TPA: FAD-dependent oxidoreductase [Stackebrandtia sp.]|uniref:NAD(P)/FAD-dependent oxidoreductase n=1 Tax=Stackebrandtia sp. TaxID=2023065 RepID=UPI002D588ADA|nr:FAD-dependent oxidoreductase [Stackebrandtia sp.]HZE39772.1 FAD-dependent oxidoreductase [Stackebrandtia sp.]